MTVVTSGHKRRRKSRDRSNWLFEEERLFELLTVGAQFIPWRRCSFEAREYAHQSQSGYSYNRNLKRQRHLSYGRNVITSTLPKAKDELLTVFTVSAILRMIVSDYIATENVVNYNSGSAIRNNVLLFLRMIFTDRWIIRLLTWNLYLWEVGANTYSTVPSIDRSYRFQRFAEYMGRCHRAIAISVIINILSHDRYSTSISFARVSVRLNPDANTRWLSTELTPTFFAVEKQCCDLLTVSENMACFADIIQRIQRLVFR